MNRKELIQKFITKLKSEIEKEREYCRNLLEYPELVDEKICRLDLCKLDAVEAFFCNEDFYQSKYDNGIYIIGDELLELLCIRNLSTARDLMESVGLTSRFTNPKNFEFNLISIFELGILKEQLKESQQ